MRLLWYWLGFIALLAYALSLDTSNLLFPFFVFVLFIYAIMLLYATLRSIIISLWRSIVERVKYNKRERAIHKRDETTESPLEIALARALDEKHIPYVREYAISRIHVDFAFPEKKLAVECDGYRYHAAPEQRARDQKRDKFLHDRGWRVLRFSGDRILSDTDGCIRKIQEYL